MKSLVALTTLFLLMMSVGCSEKSTPAGGFPSGGSSSGQSESGIPIHNRAFPAADATPPETAFDREAANIAIHFWNPMKNGESYYVGYTQASHDPKCPNKGRVVFELRNVSVEIAPSITERGQPMLNGVTEAQRLNGMEWDGIVRLLAGVGRVDVLSELPLPPPMLGGDYRLAPAQNKGWSDWRDNMTFNVPLTRKKGKWKIGEPGATHMWGPDSTTPLNKPWDHHSTFERVDPSEISK